MQFNSTKRQESDLILERTETAAKNRLHKSVVAVAKVLASITLKYLG